MIHITFSLFAEIMLWGTVPLIVGLGLWEHHLTLPEADHKLVQLMLVLIVFGWAYLWNSLRVRDRLTHFTEWNVNPQKIYHILPGITDREQPILTPDTTERHLDARKNVSHKIVERYHVSNN